MNPEAFARGRLEQHLITILVLDARHGGAGRAEHAHALGRRLQETPQRGAAGDRFLLVAAVHDDVGQSGVGRIRHQAAEFDFLVIKGLIVLRSGATDGVVIRIDGLDEHDAGGLAAPGASAGLGEQLEGPLGGAKIGQAQAHVGADDADQSDVGDIVTLGDHLRAHQDVIVAIAKRGQDGLVFALARTASRSSRAMRALGNAPCNSSSTRSEPRPMN